LPETQKLCIGPRCKPNHPLRRYQAIKRTIGVEGWKDESKTGVRGERVVGRTGNSQA